MKINMQPTSQIIAHLGLQPNGDTQQFFTNTCALHMDKYVPFDTGTLAGTVVVNGHTNNYNVYENAIIYSTDYAKYVYYGIAKDGKYLQYQKDKHPLATRYWDRKMLSAEGKKLAKEVEDYIKTRR